MSALSYAVDLWSRDIRETKDVCESAKRIIKNDLGEAGLTEIDDILVEKWDEWENSMQQFFSEENWR